MLLERTELSGACEATVTASVSDPCSGHGTYDVASGSCVVCDYGFAGADCGASITKLGPAVAADTRLNVSNVRHSVSLRVGTLVLSMSAPGYMNWALPKRQTVTSPNRLLFITLR